MRVFLALVSLVIAVPAFAQQPDRISPFVLDVRGAFLNLKQDPVTADTLTVATDDLASHTFGIVGGLHGYPFRRGGFALGLGAELLVAKASKQNTDVDGVPSGPIVQRRLQSLSGQISFNFGHRQGWSYFTAGIGPTVFDTYLADTIPDGVRSMTQNFGFGARWFNGNRAAFEVDLRFYLSNPADATLLVGGRQRESIVVMSAGIGIK